MSEESGGWEGLGPIVVNCILINICFIGPVFKEFFLATPINIKSLFLFWLMLVSYEL